MHYLIPGSLLHNASAIVLTLAAWIGQSSDTASAAAGAAEAELVTVVGIHDAHHLPEPTASQLAAEFRMIELLVIACRQDNCRQVSLLYDSHHVSLMTCMVMGQHEAARWQAANPAWHVRRWSCRLADTSEKTV